MGKLYVVGVGSGNYEDLTIKADRTLKKSNLIYCDEKIYTTLVKYLDISKLVKNSYNATRDRCVSAVKSAIKDNNIISIVGSGDTGVYGISSIVIELIEELTTDIGIEIIPGITSAISGASLLGSPLTKDFAVISLSDNLSDKQKTIDRIVATAKTNFGIVFYSPCNPSHKNLLLAKEILLQHRKPTTIVGIAKHIGNEDEHILLTNLQDLNIDEIDTYTTLFIGRDDTRVSTKTKKMITPLY